MAVLTPENRLLLHNHQIISDDCVIFCCKYYNYRPYIIIIIIIDPIVVFLKDLRVIFITPLFLLQVCIYQIILNRIHIEGISYVILLHAERCN